MIIYEIYQQSIQSSAFTTSVVKRLPFSLSCRPRLYRRLFDRHGFSALCPPRGIVLYAKTSEKLIFFSHKEDEKEVNRFNPCNFLAEFLMRNNPKYGKNKKTHEKFLRYTRKERKSRMISTKEDIMFRKVTDFYNVSKVTLNKLNIESFVKKVDGELGLNDNLVTWEWLEHFRVYKDNQTITLEEFLKAFKLAVLDLHQINEEMTQKLLEE
jgi:hypothetical protein